MKKFEPETIVIKKDVHVEIEPVVDFRLHGHLDIPGQVKRGEEEVRVAHEISQQVERHVDDCRYVHVIYKSITTCRYCGFDYEVNPGEEPICCDTATQDWLDWLEQEKRSKCPSCGLMSVIDGVCTECGAKEE